MKETNEMRALPSLLLAGAVGLGGLMLAPAAAEAHGGWRGRDYYGGHYVPPPRAYYGPGFHGPRHFGPRYYAPPPVVYRPPPPVFYRPPPAYFGPGPGFYGPRSFGPGFSHGPGFHGGPGVGLWIR